MNIYFVVLHVESWILKARQKPLEPYWGLFCTYNSLQFALPFFHCYKIVLTTNVSVIECVCNIIGTNHTAGPCDRVTGQCPCLPNVIGQKCDMSAPGFWNMTEEVGSTSCDCDPEGSIGMDCNEVGNGVVGHYYIDRPLEMTSDASTNAGKNVSSNNACARSQRNTNN